MPYTTTTLEEFREALARSWDDSVFWTDEQARLAINEALRDWNLLTGRWRTSKAYNTAAGKPSIDLGATILYGMRVKYGTSLTWDPLHPTSVTELDFGRPTWRTETTASGGDVPTQPLLWAPESLQRIVIWPATAGITTGLLWVEGIAATPILVEEGDTVDLGEEHLDILTNFALHIALFSEGGSRWASTMPYWQVFLQAAAEENGRLKRSQKYRRMAGLDRRRDLQPPMGAKTKIDDLLQQALARAAGAGET